MCLCPWDFPGKNTRMGCHFLLQGIFPTQRSNPYLLHCRQILYHLIHQGSPKLHSRIREKWIWHLSDLLRKGGEGKWAFGIPLTNFNGKCTFAEAISWKGHSNYEPRSPSGNGDWVIPPGKCWRPAGYPVAVKHGWILVYEVKRWGRL